ncbi:cysteine-rich with EGF-like domain protein 2 [Sitophilus oryzae]|uniref:Cysteine-rich with EGF-like domain protein 2 n=1 Tax=Sitophilus oryzae TaxID=7048 RepID=A0A6J2XC28_SITOR|nr:cysteine-rich with EGF-like domain protein 2 [Sitophilus oryzae]
MQSVFYITFVLFIITSNCCTATESIEKIKRDKEQKTRLPPCRACKMFVDSFNKGLERTSKYKFEGGDAAWEEEKLGSYAHSEVRFVEIHEKLCSDVSEGRDQCYQLLEEYDEELESWWFKQQKQEPNLFNHLCINTNEVCCPENHFGRTCTPCHGYPNNICNNNGKCKGAGTRKGNGMCHCDTGYKGDVCDICSDGFYESYRDDKKVLCSPCHISCDGTCSKAGPAGCEKCKEGWEHRGERGCVDDNECLTEKSPCKKSEFCINTEGSFKCLDCHKSCSSCTGDGPDECLECASGFRKKGNICVSENDEDRKKYVTFSRYLTYFGLCLCTCIISNKNIYLAAIVGLCVGIYITLSEYMLSSSDGHKTDLREQLAEQLKKSFGSN